MIVDGLKTVEYRRVVPVQARTPPIAALLYASGSTGRVVAQATVAGLEDGEPEQIWRRFSARGGIEKPAFDEYFAGASRAVALILTDIRAADGRTLHEVRRRWAGFNPPQSFRYLSSQQAALLHF